MPKGEFSLSNKTKGRIPSISFAVIKDDILGKNYSLSIAFVENKKSQELNRVYRGKNWPTNILSFPLSKENGEIVICPAVAKKEVKEGTATEGRDFREWLGFLVIHGMLHLKGMEHSSRMEKAETKYDKKYFYRDRPGHHHDSGRSGRISKRRKNS